MSIAYNIAFQFTSGYLLVFLCCFLPLDINYYLLVVANNLLL
jgi:hypothetical protein